MKKSNESKEGYVGQKNKKKWWNAGYASIAIIVFAVFFWLAWHLAFDTKLDQTRLNTFFTGALAIGSILTAIAIVAAFAQVREAKKQLKDNRAWNKMSFALTYLPSLEMIFRWEQELEKTFVHLSSRNEPLSHAEVNLLFLPEHADTHLMLKTFMNALEAYCVAINSGLAHDDIAKRIYGYKLLRHYVELKPYIDRQRIRCHDDHIFGEIEAVWARWSKDIDVGPPKYGTDD